MNLIGSRYLLFFLFIQAACFSYSQEKKVALGLGFSPSINWLKANSDAMESDGSRIGYAYGLLADFNFGENYALATGIYINNCGGKSSHKDIVDSSLTTVSETYKIQYLQIPITLRMRTKEIGYLKYYGQFGLNPELAINARADETPSGGDTKKNVNKMSEVIDLNLSLVLGLGVIYNLSGTTNFVIGISYHNGFIDILKGSAGGYIPVEKRAATNQFALNLGVLF